MRATISSLLTALLCTMLPCCAGAPAATATSEPANGEAAPDLLVEASQRENAPDEQAFFRVSTDGGATWEEVPSGVTGTISQVAVGAGRAVAAMAVTSPELGWCLLTSSDGRTWRRIDEVKVPVTSIVYASGRFVAGAKPFDAPGPVFLTSTDGETFEPHRPDCSCADLPRIVFGADRFVANCGRSICHSADGATWSEANLGEVSHIRSLSWSGEAFSGQAKRGDCFGEKKTAACRDIVEIRSEDGIEWTVTPLNAAKDL